MGVAPVATWPCDSAPGGLCANYNIPKESLVHPSLDFEYTHSGKLCLGLIPDCVQRTNHTTICSRTSFGACNGAAKPELSLNMETVALVLVNDFSTRTEDAPEDQEMPPFYDYLRARCTLDQMLYGECVPSLAKNPDSSCTGDYLAIADLPRQEKIGSGFQNTWNNQITNYEAHMHGTLVEDGVGFTYVGLKYGLNKGDTDIASKTTNVAHATYDSMAGLWNQAGSEEKNAAWREAHAKLQGSAPFPSTPICATGVTGKSEGKCVGQDHVVKSKDIEMSFFFVNSGNLEQIPYFYHEKNMTHATFRTRIWSPEGLGTQEGLYAWESLKINGQPLSDEFNLLDNVKNISWDKDNLVFIFPDKYDYGTLDNNGDFVPLGRDAPTVFATVHEHAPGIGAMYLDFHAKLEHVHEKDRYILYNTVITNRYGSDETKPVEASSVAEATVAEATKPAEASSVTVAEATRPAEGTGSGAKVVPIGGAAAALAAVAWACCAH